MAALATQAGVEGRPVQIHTPLIRFSKAEIIRAGSALGVAYGLTLSCYDPSPEGAPCGQCESCLLRKKGFAEAGIPDPPSTLAAGPPPPAAEAEPFRQRSAGQPTGGASWSVRR